MVGGNFSSTMWHVFAAQIDSTADPKQAVDWRHYPVFGLSRFYSIHILPEVEKERCRKIVRSLGLCFG